MEERSDDEVFKIENKGLVNENEENECVVEGQSVCDKNGLIIATIVYQCVDCVTICHTISEANQHYVKCHQNRYLGKEIDAISAKEVVINKRNAKIVGKTNGSRVGVRFKRRKVLKVNQNISSSNNKYNKRKNVSNGERNADENEMSSRDETEFKCDHCDNCYLNVYSLRRHNKIHTDPEICSHPNCGKMFATERELSSHMECHNSTAKSRYKCSHCAKAFKRESNLKIHANLHTNPVICHFPDCHKKLATNARLKEHLLSHSSETPLKCDWPGCDFAAKVASNLKAHKRTHTGEKPFHCCWPGCGQSFAAQSTLNGHVESRHEMPAIKRFKCEWPACESSFSKKSGLKDHRRTHTGEKPYHCVWPNCGQCFSTLSVLHNHRLTHTGERRFHCEFADCGARFATSSTLNTHKKLVHKCDYIKRSRWDNKKK